MKSPMVNIYHRAFACCRDFSLFPQIRKAGIRPAHKTGIGKTVFLDDSEGLVCLSLIGAEVEHPVAAIYDLPAPLDLLDCRRCRVEGNTVLTSKSAYRRSA